MRPKKTNVLPAVIVLNQAKVYFVIKCVILTGIIAFLVFLCIYFTLSSGTLTFIGITLPVLGFMGGICIAFLWLNIDFYWASQKQGEKPNV